MVAATPLPGAEPPPGESLGGVSEPPAELSSSLLLSPPEEPSPSLLLSLPLELLSSLPVSLLEELSLSRELLLLLELSLEMSLGMSLLPGMPPKKPSEMPSKKLRDKELLLGGTGALAPAPVTLSKNEVLAVLLFMIRLMISCLEYLETTLEIAEWTVLKEWVMLGT